MSRTIHTFKGKKFPAKTRKKQKDKKCFGFTSGTHSHFDELTEKQKGGRNYPVKGKDFIKYGYGNGSVRRVKNYKMEIE